MMKRPINNLFCFAPQSRSYAEYSPKPACSGRRRIFSTLALAVMLLWARPAFADTTTYDFATCAAASNCDTSTATWASGDDVDVFPFGGDTANRNGHTE